MKDLLTESAGTVGEADSPYLTSSPVDTEHVWAQPSASKYFFTVEGEIMHGLLQYRGTQAYPAGNAELSAEIAIWDHLSDEAIGDL